MNSFSTRMICATLSLIGAAGLVAFSASAVATAGVQGPAVPHAVVNAPTLPVS